MQQGQKGELNAAKARAFRGTNLLHACTITDVGYWARGIGEEGNLTTYCVGVLVANSKKVLAAISVAAPI